MGCFALETCNLWVASFVLKIHRLTLWDTFVVVLCWCLYLWPKNSCWCAFALSLPSYCAVLPRNVTYVSLTEHDKQISALKRLDSLWIRNSKTSSGVNIVTCRSWMNQLLATYYSLKNELHHFTMYSTQKMQHFFYFAQLCFSKSSAHTPIILHLTEVENNTLRFQLAPTLQHPDSRPRLHHVTAAITPATEPCGIQNNAHAPTSCTTARFRGVPRNGSPCCSAENTGRGYFWQKWTAAGSSCAQSRWSQTGSQTAEWRRTSVQFKIKLSVQTWDLQKIFVKIGKY